MPQKKIRFDVVTIFPEIISGYFANGIVAQGIKKGLLFVETWNLREFASNNYKQVDDRVFGGGAGMVLMFDPIARAIDAIRKHYLAVGIQKYAVFATTAGGVNLTQQLVKEYESSYDALIILAGRYEGFDQRILDELVDFEFSVGDYVLSGGELPALIMVDAISRLIPGVLGKEESFKTDSFYRDAGYIQHPQYTRPAEIDYLGKKLTVPDVLLSGNHADIDKWREGNSRRKSTVEKKDAALE